MALLFCVLATVIHFLETNTSIINLIVPPLSTVCCCLLLLRLRQKPEQINQVGYLFAALIVTMMAVCNLYFIGQALLAPDNTLVDILPGPLAISLPVPLLVLAVFVSSYRLKQTTVLYWDAIAAPVFLYLLTHPVELKTLRGQELAFLTGPVMLGQSAFLMLYVHLRDVVEHLYTERLQYYAKILERQSIRQQAIDQTLAQIHNGPLQTLAMLLLDIRGQKLGSSPALIHRIEHLNAEIRAVGNSLVDEELAYPAVNGLSKTLEEILSDWILRLGDGVYLDLHLPIHELFYKVFSATIARDLPHLHLIRAKMRSFDELPSDLDFDRKRALCLWLEEAICNVGKHAIGATHIKATGKSSHECYVLSVQDNGCGPQIATAAAGQHQVLAKRLGGQFRRKSLSDKGTICELSWRLSDKKKPLTMLSEATG